MPLNFYQLLVPYLFGFIQSLVFHLINLIDWSTCDNDSSLSHYHCMFYWLLYTLSHNVNQQHPYINSPSLKQTWAALAGRAPLEECALFNVRDTLCPKGPCKGARALKYSSVAFFYWTGACWDRSLLLSAVGTFSAVKIINDHSEDFLRWRWMMYYSNTSLLQCALRWRCCFRWALVVLHLEEALRRYRRRAARRREVGFREKLLHHEEISTKINANTC